MTPAPQPGTDWDGLEIRPTPNLTSLVTGIVNDAQELAKQQFELFKREMKDEVQKTKEAALCFGSGGSVVALGVVLLCLGLVHGLYWALPAVDLWGWYAIVGSALIGCGGALLYVGKRKLASFNPLPGQSVEALKENIQWITHPRK